MSKNFVTADLHFGHQKIMEYENRPFASVEIMNETMIQNWNRVVSNQDTVFVLGDVSFLDQENTKAIVERLHGHKILIMGNHDQNHSINWWLEVGFQEVSNYPIIVDEFIVMSHNPPSYYNEATPYFYLYGHVHASEMYQTITKQTACVSVERWEYTPVTIDRIKTLLQEKFSS